MEGICTMMGMDYHNRPEWSYSQMKNILDHGIDYAVAAKRGGIAGPASKNIDLGELAHMFVLGGDAEIFVVTPFADFRTKKAREWKAEQIKRGKTIVTKEQYDAIAQIVDNIERHPMSKKLLKGEDIRHEVEMYATIAGVDLRGKADVLRSSKSSTERSITLTDIKTTAQFDDWKYKSARRHYDLQAIIYSLIGAKALGAPLAATDFYFCVAETVTPYRVQYHHVSPSFRDHGEVKLATCLQAIKDFGDKEPNFLIEEVNELGEF